MHNRTLADLSGFGGLLFFNNVTGWPFLSPFLSKELLFTGANKTEGATITQQLRRCRKECCLHLLPSL